MEMTMPRKSFSVATSSEPISFDLVGPVRGPQNFACRDRMAAGKLMRFAELFSSIQEEMEDGSQSQTASQGAKAIPAIRDFFNAALMPEGRGRFWEMIESDDEGIPLDTLVEIAGWLAEVYSGSRPTGTTSEPGSEVISSGDGSPAGQQPAAIPTYSRSEPTPSMT